MAKVYSLKVSNFRCIENFEQSFGKTNFICLIGRGDSGKTTILEAIKYALYPNWNLTIQDTDFYNNNTGNTIEIEVTLYDLSKKLLREEKYGLHIRGIDFDTSEIHDTIRDDHEAALTIRFTVDSELEPKWYVINSRQEPIEIRHTDRDSLNMSFISDYIDRHFSWSKGNPLYSLLNQGNSGQPISNTVLISALREAKNNIGSTAFAHLDDIANSVKDEAINLGVTLGEISNTIDFKDISIRDGKICLHDDAIPFRLKGKGSKKLTSIAIQLGLIEDSGIILIDEIEYGLEPDRVQNLVNRLKDNDNNQFFITTHSSNVLVELDAKHLYLMKKGQESLNSFDGSLQGCLRNNPEAFFTKRVIVCEGATEVGFCRAINDFRIANGERNISYLGVGLVDGSGSTFIEYCKGFKSLGFDVSAFCDSDIDDKKVTEEKKNELRSLGINVNDCDIGNSIEEQIFNDILWSDVQELLEYGVLVKGKQSVETMIKNNYNGDKSIMLWDKTDTPELRKSFGLSAKNGEWFKNIERGTFLGKFCCDHLDSMQEKTIFRQINDLLKWIDNE